MWCRWRTTITAVTFGVTASLVSYEFTSVAQSQNYTPSEFRSVLGGLGYNVPQQGEALTDQATQSAIRELQQRYNLNVDGVADKTTQDVVMGLIRNLQGSLNLVVKPSPSLPRNASYDPEITAAVQQFQTQFNLPVTGIANLETRYRLEQEARRILGKEPLPSSSSPDVSPSPGMTPSPDVSPSPGMTPSPDVSPSPGMTPSPDVSPSPGMTPSPDVSPSPGMAPSP